MIVAVSGLNNTDNPAPAIPVAKSLVAKHKVIGLSYDPNEPANFMDIIEKKYLMPYPSLGIEELKNRLAYLKEKENLEAIIPNLDAELPLYIKYQQDIENMGIKLCLPSLENFELRNKNNLDTLCDNLAMTYPKTREITSIKELSNIAEDATFPLMIKGNYYKAYKVYNLQSAIEAFYTISNEWGFPILVQDVVEGEEINLVGVGDGKGELKGAVAIKKLTTTAIGKIWTGITIQNQALIDIAKQFVQNTKWKGPFELECMINHNDIHLIEINPRFPAWVYFATGVGINLPQMVIDIMQNKEVQTKLSYPSNKMYVRFTDELITDFNDFTTLLTQKEL